MSPTRPRIVIAEAYAADAVERLRAAGDVVEVIGATDSELRAALSDAAALLVRTYVRVDAGLLDAAPRLRVIGRGGVGLDNIDVSAARARGVTVVYTPAASTRCVAEHTLALLLAVERRILAGDAAVRGGTFRQARDATVFRELGDLTLGIVGMGRIGSAAARIAALGFGMRVVYTDLLPVGPFDFPATPVQLPRLLAESDVISLHVPLTEQTQGMIDAQALARCRSTAVLLNTSRGAVVDAAALAEALTQGRLAGAGIDVFDAEPVPAGHPLRCAPNAVLSPHVAGRSAAALARMNDVVDDVIRVLSGSPPRFAADSGGW